MFTDDEIRTWMRNMRIHLFKDFKYGVQPKQIYVSQELFDTLSAFNDKQDGILGYDLADLGDGLVFRQIPVVVGEPPFCERAIRG